MQGNFQGDLQVKIHHILSRYGFYRLPLISLLSILRLLNVEEARQAKAIQIIAISGLIRFTDRERQKRANYFLEGIHRQQVVDVQEYLSGIIRAVIDERIVAEGRERVETAMRDSLGYPSYTYNVMGYGPSGPGLFGGGQMARPPLAFANPYLPYNNYNNPDMYYYHMYGSFPAQVQNQQNRMIAQRAMGEQNHQKVNQGGQPLRSLQRGMMAEEKVEKKQERDDYEMIDERKEERKQGDKAYKIQKKDMNKSEDSSAPFKKSRRLEEKREKLEGSPDMKIAYNQISDKKKEILDKIFLPPKSHKAKPKEVDKSQMTQKQKQQQKKKVQNVQNTQKTQNVRVLRSHHVEKKVDEKINEKVVNKSATKQEKQEKQKQVPIKAPQKATKVEKHLNVPLKKHEQIIPQPLELKYYNSISDFDYRVFKNPLQHPTPTPIKKESATVQTQTDLNLLLNQYRIIPKHKQVHIIPSNNTPRVRHPPRPPPPSPSPPPPPPLPVPLPNHHTIQHQIIKKSEKIVIQYNHPKDKLPHKEWINDLQIQDYNQSSLKVQKSQGNHLLEIVSSQIKLQEQEHFGLAIQIDHQPQSCIQPPKHPDLIEELSENQHEDIPQNIQVNKPQPQPQPDIPSLPQVVQPPPIPTQPILENCICEGAFSGPTLACMVCQEKYHRECHHVREGQQEFTCPRCRIRNLDPFLKIQRVIGEYYMRDLPKGDFKARVKVGDLEYLDRRKGQERLEEIQLRCLRIDIGDELNEVTWPDEAEVRVNGCKLTQFYRSSSLRKRKDAPLIITQAVFKLSQYDIQDCGITEIAIAINANTFTPNLPHHRPRTITIPASSRLPSNNNGIFILGIYHTRKHSISSLFQEFEANLLSCGIEFIHGLLMAQNEELSLQKQIFRIQDPLSGQVMQIPVRGISCRHAQCFDLHTFITLTSGLKNRPWRCPVCGRQARKFIADRWMQETIQTLVQANTIPIEIAYKQDGHTILRMGRPQDEEEEFDEDDQKRKTKQIKKKQKVTVKREGIDEQIRIFDANFDGDIDKYLADEWRPMGRQQHKM